MEENETIQDQQSFESGWESQELSTEEIVETTDSEEISEEDRFDSEENDTENDALTDQELSYGADRPGNAPENDRVPDILPMHTINPEIVSTDAKLSRQKDFFAFAMRHPEVKAEDIPGEVWQAVSAGTPIETAWTYHENDRMRAKIRELEQMEKNRSRSSGTRQSSGNTRGSDPFDAGWQDI